MRRESIALIWIGGLVLAVVLYAIGPDRFFETVIDVIDGVDAFFHALAFRLGAQVYSVVRALTIAIYGVFAVLALLAAQRGQRGLWPLIVVTLAVMFLVWRPFGEFPTPVGRWIIALALVVAGALVMTQRLIAPSARPPVQPYPPGHRP